MFHRVKSEPPAQQKPTPATQTAPASQAQPSQHGTPHQEQPAEAARATQQQSSKPQPETAQIDRKRASAFLRLVAFR